jgi:hypothetical protein
VRIILVADKLIRSIWRRSVYSIELLQLIARKKGRCQVRGGILVAPDSREALVAGFAAGMKTLAQSHNCEPKWAKPAIRGHASTLIGSAGSIKF